MEWVKKLWHLSPYRVLVLTTLLVILIIYTAYDLLLHTTPVTSNELITVDEKEYDDALLQRCFYRAFSDSILVLNFNFPYYTNVDTLKDLYEGVFGHVVTCGPEPTAFDKSRTPDIVFDVQQGHFSYHCLALAIEKFPNYKGYFYGQDDMIINWWTFTQLDRHKIWHGTKVIDWRQQVDQPILKPDWIWWKTNMGMAACKNYYNKLKQLAQHSAHARFDAVSAFRTYMANSRGRPRCAKGWSDFFYIPGHMAHVYNNLSHIAYQHELYLEIAVHNILRSMDVVKNFVLVDGVYMPDEGYADYSTGAFWKLYNHQIAFIHPYKFHTDDKFYSGSQLKHNVIRFKQKLTDCNGL